MYVLRLEWKIDGMTDGQRGENENCEPTRA